MSLIRRLQAPVIMRMLKPKRHEVILDAGCGGGFFTYEIAKKCKLAVGVDWNLPARLVFGMHTQPNMVCVEGDVQCLPFDSEKFDKILLSSVLQMVTDDVLLLQECRRVLKSEGVVVLSVPTDYCYLMKLNGLKPQLKERFGARGKAYYSSDEVIMLLRHGGFEVTETEYSPKKWGAAIFEIGLFLWYRFGFPFFSPALFAVFYPIAYLDRFGSRRQKGNEIVISARKVQN